MVGFLHAGTSFFRHQSRLVLFNDGLLETVEIKLVHNSGTRHRRKTFVQGVVVDKEALTKSCPSGLFGTYGFTEKFRF